MEFSASLTILWWESRVGGSEGGLLEAVCRERRVFGCEAIPANGSCSMVRDASSPVTSVYKLAAC